MGFARDFYQYLVFLLAVFWRGLVYIWNLTYVELPHPLDEDYYRGKKKEKDVSEDDDDENLAEGAAQTWRRDENGRLVRR